MCTAYGQAAKTKEDADVIFTRTKFEGAFLVELEPVGDERGFVARGYCRREFEAVGLNPNLAQCDISFNRICGTLRGLYFRLEPHATLVRCTRGSIYNVIIDLRPGSRTFMRWIGMPLTHENRSMLYFPGGFAHGYLTLADKTEVFLQQSNAATEEYTRGIRWDDPAFKINWPIQPLVISEDDQRHPDFTLGLQLEPRQALNTDSTAV